MNHGVAMFAACLLGWATLAAAQDYPSKPVRLIAPFPPGGGTDILARGIASPVAEARGQPEVVDNRPGAGGMTGAETVARSAPDGYTIIIVASTYATTSAYAPPSYDPIDGIQPIVLIGTTGLLLVVHPSVPVKSVKELADFARSDGAKLNYASVGSGSIPHLAIELFKLNTGAKLTHVPYKGAGPAMIALVGGEMQVATLSMVPILPHIKAARLRALAITTPNRSSVLADIPAIAESVPGFEATHWYGMWGPKRMPGAVVARWNREVTRVLGSDEMKARLRAEGLEYAAGTPEAFGEVIRRDIHKWRAVIKQAQIKREL